MLDLLKDAQKCLSPWFNVVPRLEKLCQAVVAKNNQEKLQPTLNKGAGGTSLTIFVKKMEKGFSKTQNFFFFFFFLKNWPIFRRRLYRYVYWLNFGLNGACISKNFTNKEQQNLLYILTFFSKPSLT